MYQPFLSLAWSLRYRIKRGSGLSTAKFDKFLVEEVWPSGLRRELRCGEARVRISEQAEVFLRDGRGEMVVKAKEGEIMKGRSFFF